MTNDNSARSLLMIAVLLYCSHVAFAQQGIAVVVNPHNPQTNISLGDLRKLMVGEKHNWPDGSAVKLFTRTSGTREHDAMLKLVGMSETEYKQYWRTRVYDGEAQSEPVALPSNGMQREAVQTYPGGIALVDASDVKFGMKILKIDGKAPADSGYPLTQ
jgi:ABC-type phosphate transport system substrate-binding protein